jgi:peptide/nickel transport system substrate-binding protein
MPNFRYTTRLIIAFVSRFKAILIGSAVFGVLLFLVLRFLTPVLFANKTDKIGIIGRYNTTNLPYPILNLVGEGLTKLDESGIPQPSLAEKWSSPDGKVWTFTLAEGKTWQDGSPVVASSISYTFEDVKVDRPNERTLVFTLEAPFAPFPTVVSKTIFKRGLLGTGEWVVERVTLANGFIEELEMKNEAGDIKNIHFYPSEDLAKHAYKMGEITSIEDVIDPSPLGEWNNTLVEKQSNLRRFVAIFFNVENEMLQDKSTRQALSYAINKDQFEFVRAANPFSPLSWAYNAQTKPYAYDQARAKDLLRESKIKNAEIKLIATPVLLSVAEKVARDWAAVGVKTTVALSADIPEDYQAYMVMYDIPTDPDQYATWHSTQAETNISKYKNPRIDKLLEDGRQELNLENRKKIYLDFQRFLMEDAPAAFLYYPASYTIRRK